MTCVVFDQSFLDKNLPRLASDLRRDMARPPAAAAAVNFRPARSNRSKLDSLPNEVAHAVVSVLWYPLELSDADIFSMFLVSLYSLQYFMS